YATSHKKPILQSLNEKVQLIVTSFVWKGLMREKMAGIFCYNYSSKTSNILRQVIQDSADPRCI
ncbi:hypothetical protein ACX4K2_001658, partial [Listeria monocytogenes]